MKHLRFFMVTFFLSALGIIIWVKAPTSPVVMDASISENSNVKTESQVSINVINSAPELLTTNTAQTLKKPLVDTEWKTGKVPQVLLGTNIDGELDVDVNGNLKVSLAVKDFFDYFLSAVGELTPEQALGEIHAQVLNRLPPEAAKQAMRLLDDYLAYQKHMADLMAQPLIPTDQQDYAYFSKMMKQSFAEVKMLRRQYMSPDAVEAFFGMEETFSDYSVKSIEIQADNSLSDTEKQQKKRALENTMPEQMRFTSEASQKRIQLVTEAQKMISQGVDSSEIRALLDANNFDAKETEHILSFYHQEQKWNGRVDTYLQRKQNLVQKGLSAGDQEQQFQQLRNEYFSEDELPRLLSEEAIARKIAASAQVSESKNSGTGS